jgi:Ca-activated chloride channel family protein
MGAIVNGLASLSRQCAIVCALAIAALAIAGVRVGWRDLWLTADQRGRILMRRNEPAAAADAFRDPFWRGIALFRGGDFKAAAQALSRVENAEGFYDEGNALVMLGRYEDAAKRYDRALRSRPGWSDAVVNRAIALARAASLKVGGGDMDDTEPGETDLVFDKTAKGGKDDNAEHATTQMSDEAIRAIWLKRVQTRPADFLRARFAYQLQNNPTTSGGDAKVAP